MKIAISKDKPGEDLYITFSLANGQCIIFNAKEREDNKMFFEIESNLEYELMD